MKIDKKEKAVVVIGSGPGGAQVAYQLTKQGIPVVLLEAGRRIMKEEYVNEEWPAFSQMAWLDKRTMSGNARICLLYTSPSPRDSRVSRMPSSA